MCQSFNTSYNACFAVNGFKMLSAILKGSFQISHKILNPYRKICILLIFEFAIHDIF